MSLAARIDTSKESSKMKKDMQSNIKIVYPSDTKILPYHIDYLHCQAQVYFIHNGQTRNVPHTWIRSKRCSRGYWTTNSQYLCYFTADPELRKATPHIDFSVPYARKLRKYGGYLYTVNVLNYFGPLSDDYLHIPGEEPGDDTNESNDEDNVETGSVNPTEPNVDKLMLALENATEKSAQTRVTALQAIVEILSHPFLPAIVEDHKATIIDVLHKSIRRGKNAEQKLAIQIVSMLVLQLGSVGKVIEELGPTMLVIAQNASCSTDVRAKCCCGLGLLMFLGHADTDDVEELMQQLERIFSGSYVKASKTLVTSDASALHCAALSAWGLLLTLLPSEIFCKQFKKKSFAPSMDNLVEMLNSQHLAMRSTAGEVIALVIERGRCCNDGFQKEYMPELIEATQQLATDFHKYHAKRNLKTQRAIFREVSRYLEEDELPEMNICFGRESLELDTWAIRHQYNALCAILGPAMNSHLSENGFLRDILQIGEKIVPLVGRMALNQQLRFHRKIVYATTSKSRTVSRNRGRDKRSAKFSN